jgi:acyl-coenzyme A synthetase/AMP-(fatty) acid ligase
MRPIMGERYRDIHRIMVENAERFGDKDYVISVDQDKQISFSQINHYCNKVANFLKDKDVKEDDRVSLIGKNSIETLIIFFGVLKYGAVISPINVEESRENIYRIISRVKPKFVVYSEGLDFDYTKTPYSWIPFCDFDEEGQPGDGFFSLIHDCDSVFRTPLGGKADIGEILFTSGTTEVPKGVVISREGLFYMVDEVIDRMGITEEDRILEYRAYSWASTQLTSILSSMTSGATLILAQKFSRSQFGPWLKENDVTISTGVPAVINILITDPVEVHKEDIPNLKFMTSSSAPLSKEKHRIFEGIYGIPINQMAGMSEAGWMMGTPPEKRKIGSVGTPVIHKEVCVVDERCRKCGVGEEGEIVVRGKSMGIGYLNDDGSIEKFPHNGFPTGDLGYMDSEDYVFITGRKKDLIIRGGVNISPMEITDRLMQHPYVQEAVTLGIPHEIYGEEVACFIVPKSGCKIEKQNIIDHCKDELPDFKLPKVVCFLEEIPKTERGKVAKGTLSSVIRQDKSRQTS